MVIKFDQTPLKIAPCEKSTLAKNKSSFVTITATTYKKSVTGTFSTLLSGKCLPIELIYGEPKGLEGFFLTVKEKHFPSRLKAAKFKDKTIVPYMIRRF